MIAKAASRGILDYMDDCKSELTFLSRFEGIIDFDEPGKELIKKYYENSAEQIEAITRIDPNGIILATYPENNEVIGKNISNQRHIREMIESHEPVISDVFMSIQGYLAIAIHIPVFNENEFKGSLAVLIAMDKIGKRYLENIRSGESGYAFLLSENNIEIYCPYHKHIGISIIDISINDPSVLKLIDEIKKEDFGSLNCIHDKSETLDNGEKHVVYYRIPLGNTYWTILISIPKAEVYKTIAGFQYRLILLFSVLIIIILVYFYFFTKARTVLKAEAKRKIAEKALLKSEEKYRLISGVTSDYLFTSILNDEGNIQLNWVAGAFEHITGYSLDEYIALGGWRKTLHPDDLEKDDLDMENLHKNQKVITEVRTYHKNGTLLWVRVYANPIWNDKEDKLTGIYGAVQDITERKNAEEKLIESEAYNRTLFDQSPIGLALTNMDGKLLDVNHAFAEIIGRTIEETLRLSYWDITPKEYAAQEQKQFDEIVTTGRYGPYVKEYIHKNGHLVPVRLLGLIIVRKGIPHIWSSVEDITESKKAEEKIKKLNEDLEEKVSVRTKDLEIKISEIERMNKLFIDRELRMIELKETIKALKAKEKRNLNN
jgi:PAS domain S-box-containing protein